MKIKYVILILMDFSIVNENFFLLPAFYCSVNISYPTKYRYYMYYRNNLCYFFETPQFYNIRKAQFINFTFLLPIILNYVIDPGRTNVLCWSYVNIARDRSYCFNNVQNKSNRFSNGIGEQYCKTRALRLVIVCTTQRKKKKSSKNPTFNRLAELYTIQIATTSVNVCCSLNNPYLISRPSTIIKCIK